MKSKLILLLYCLFIPAIILFAMIAYTPQYEPDEGIWICEELQIQLDYSGGSETFVIENDIKIHCGCGSDRGVKEIQVSCQERNHPIYELGEMIFCAEIKKLTDNTMIVYEPKAEQEYIFIRADSEVS